jgi:hypothetical protein
MRNKTSTILIICMCCTRTVITHFSMHANLLRVAKGKKPLKFGEHDTAALA